jgi:hypothetical protein
VGWGWGAFLKTVFSLGRVELNGNCKRMSMDLG